MHYRRGMKLKRARKKVIWLSFSGENGGIALVFPKSFCPHIVFRHIIRSLQSEVSKGHGCANSEIFGAVLDQIDLISHGCGA